VFFKHQSLAWSRGAICPLRSFVAEPSPGSLRERLRFAKSGRRIGYECGTPAPASAPSRMHIPPDIEFEPLQT
jgi:hypothetical protein